MPRRISEDHALPVTWSASGNISLDLSGKPYTITRLALTIAWNITTSASPGNYNDPWDRIISTINLNDKDGSIASFTDARAMAHFLRFRAAESRALTSRRAPGVAASTTGGTGEFTYIWHFGCRPKDFAGEDNPYDLTAGIAPADKGNLTLGGAWGAAAAPGSGYTVNSATMRVHLWGVQPSAGDTPQDYLPQARPNWSMLNSASVGSTSSLYSSIDNVPSGDILRSVMGMATLGSNAPRSSAMLGSYEFYNQYASRAVESFPVYQDLEIASQGIVLGVPPIDDPANPGTLLTTGISDPGLFFVRLWKLNSGGGIYGVNLEQAATGDLQHRFGVASVSGGAALEYVYEKYRLNANHPMTPANKQAHPAMSATPSA